MTVAPCLPPLGTGLGVLEEPLTAQVVQPRSRGRRRCSPLRPLPDTRSNASCRRPQGRSRTAAHPEPARHRGQRDRPRRQISSVILALLGPVASGVEAVPVVPSVVASVAGVDDAASQLQQQFLGGHLRQGVGVGRAQCVSLGPGVGVAPAQCGHQPCGTRLRWRGLSAACTSRPSRTCSGTRPSRSPATCTGTPAMTPHALRSTDGISHRPIHTDPQQLRDLAEAHG
jgi:hypothetical protein